jgi:hypothetical protein
MLVLLFPKRHTMALFRIITRDGPIRCISDAHEETMPLRNLQAQTARRNRRTGRALAGCCLPIAADAGGEGQGVKYPVLFSLVDGTDAGEIDEGRTNRGRFTRSLGCP